MELKDLLKWIGAAAFVLVFLVFAIFWVMFHRGDKSQFQQEGVNLCSSVPEPYRSIFDAAGKKFVVQPAFIAAIFYGGEHANSWPSADGPWASSPAGAQGPFQFMPGTWESNKQDGNGDGVMDVQNLWDSAFGAAHLLANIGAGGNTKDLDQLRDAASKYNSGRPWSTGQGIPETAKYVPRVIDAFNQFLCASVAESDCGQKVATEAKTHDGESGSIYYPQDASMACTAFTSYVLKKAGAIDFTTNGAQDLWDRPVGMVVVAQGTKLDPSVLNILQPGDLVFYTNTYPSQRYFTHSEIYVGGDATVGLSGTTIKYQPGFSTNSYNKQHFAGAKRFCNK